MRVRRPWIWVALVTIPVVIGAILEGCALSDPEGLTFSQFVANLSYSWPPIIFLCGLVVGMFVTHFWWPWVPKQFRAKCVACGETILLTKKPGG